MTLKPLFRLTTVLLSILSGSLIVLLILITRWGQERVHRPEHLVDRHLAQPDLSVLNPRAAPKIDLAAVRDNAVFYTHRAFFKPPAPGQTIPVPDYDFAGSIGLPQGKRLAFVQKKSDKSSRTVHVGDDLDGWRVEIIEAARVVIERDNEKVELKSANESNGSGLVHGTVTPYVVQSGLRIMGGNPAAARPPQAVIRAARTYQPPPPPRN